jgi:hypothetical protein
MSGVPLTLSVLPATDDHAAIRLSWSLDRTAELCMLPAEELGKLLQVAIGAVIVQSGFRASLPPEAADDPELDDLIEQLRAVVAPVVGRPC